MTTTSASSTTLPQAIPYDTSLETIEPDEAETIAALIETFRKIGEITFRDLRHGVRTVHAKSHGLLEGTLTVDRDSSLELAQGLFAKPGSYPVVMRFSTPPGDVLDDKVSTPRALAIKVLGVEGERLPGSEDATTQDFILVNGPSFSAPDAKSFLKSLKLLAITTDKTPGLKKALSAVLQVTEKGIEALGGKSATLVALGGHPETNLLGETYFSQLPLRFGDYVAKIAVAPITPSLVALHGAKVDLDGKPNGLRDAIVEYFRTQGGQWEIRAQLLRDRETQPIEDASKPWPEKTSPFERIGRITVPPQVAWSAARSRAVDDGLAFAPWHGLAAHRPLGGVMRARKATYEASARLRATQNGIANPEPDADFRLPTN